MPSGLLSVWSVVKPTALLEKVRISARDVIRLPRVIWVKLRDALACGLNVQQLSRKFADDSYHPEPPE